MNALEREDRELRQVNDILRNASAHFAQPELNDRIRRCPENHQRLAVKQAGLRRAQGLEAIGAARPDDCKLHRRATDVEAGHPKVGARQSAQDHDARSCSGHARTTGVAGSSKLQAQRIVSSRLHLCFNVATPCVRRFRDGRVYQSDLRKRQTSFITTRTARRASSSKTHCSKSKHSSLIRRTSIENIILPPMTKLAFLPFSEVTRRRPCG